VANPQVENGYTKIANEVLEALARIRIPGEARQVLDVILRKTYGFQKKEDVIALSQFCLATGINKPNVFRAIKQLQVMNLIIKNDNANLQTYRINKDYSQWKPLSKKITLSKKIINVIEKDNESLSKKITTKDNIQKKKEIYSPNSIEIRTSELLLSLIRQRNPNFKQPNIQSWAVHVDRMIRLDKRSPEEIEKVIRWCQQDSFWQNNILSTEKLRRQYDQLCMKAFSDNGKPVQERQRYY